MVPVLVIVPMTGTVTVLRPLVPVVAGRRRHLRQPDHQDERGGDGK
jgi:hypothetical protein